MNNLNLFHYDKSGSYCPLSSHDFAECVAADVCEAANAAAGGTLEIEVYTPPYQKEKLENFYRSGGTLILHFTSSDTDGQELAVGVEFGRADNDGNTIRRKFKINDWKKSEYPFDSGIYLANFDEAFRMITIVGARLRLRAVKLNYGGYS